MTVTPSAPSPPVAPDAGQETPAGLPRTGGRVPRRTAGIGLTSLGAPIGIGVADPLLGQIAIAIELAVALTIICTAIFGSQALSERAFRLMRWIANRPEPPACGPRGHLISCTPPDNCSVSEQLGRSYDPRLAPRRSSGVQRTSAIRADNSGN